MVRPAMALGRGVSARCEKLLSSGNTLFFCRLDQEELLHVAQLVRHLGGEVIVLRIVLGDVVKLPFVTVDHVGQTCPCPISHGPCGRRGGSEPTVVVDGAVADISKYCVVRVDGALAFALSKVYAMLTPSIGFCATPLTMSGAECRPLQGSSARCR